MAHLALTIDPDPMRRRQFLSRAAADLKSLPNLEITQTEAGELAIVWARGSEAPQSCHAQAAEFALLLGHAIDADGNRLDARTLLAQWSNPATRGEVFDGYHAAVVFSQAGGLSLGIDFSGLFPIYYADCNGALIAGTSAKLFAAHPLFETELDLRGLAGIFLANGLLDNQSLLRGVKRLGMGCQLRRETGKKTAEVETFRLQPHERHLRLSEPEARELVDAEIVRAIRRHRPGNSATTLMLSGGWDSRLMAGYLSAEGVTDSAVCLGRPTDLEAPIAARVAAALNLKLHREPQEPDAGRNCELARRVADWEHLSGGFSNLEVEASGETVGRTAPAFWSGYAVEDVLGGEAARFGLNGKTGAWSFENTFKVVNQWGLPPEILKTLLRAPEAEQWIQEQIEAFRRDYQHTGESPAQRAFRTKLATRLRFHVGSVLHRLCFNSWPLMPIFDRHLLDILYNLPAGILLERHLEKNLLIQRFPRLAKIPREHNTFHLDSLPTAGLARVPLLRAAAASLERKARRWYWQRWKKIEPRRYHRHYDLNGPSWQAVRAEAEPHRGRLDEWLNRGIVNDLLPPPGGEVKLRDVFADGAPRRTLLGLMFWAAQNS